MNRALPLALLVALVVVGLTVPVTAAGGVAAQDTVTVTITVLDGGGNPIPNVKLSASWDGGSTEETTRSNGQALVDVPRGANVTVRVDHVAYTRNKPFEIVDASGGSEEVRVARKASAELTIIDSEGPVENARVRLRKGGHLAATGRTDAGGEFTTGVIESGTYAVTVFKEGYYEKAMKMDVRRDTARNIQIEHGSVTVTFRVVDKNFDPPKPVNGATISGPEIGSVKTQSNGVQQVSLPVNAEIGVEVTKEGHQPVKHTIETGEEDMSIDVTTRKEAAISVALVNDRVVLGEPARAFVTDQYGEPVTEAKVSLDGTTIGTTDQNGVLLVPIENAGEHTLRAESGRLSSPPVTVVGVRPAPDSTPTPRQPITQTGSTQSMSTPRSDAPSDLSGVIAVPGTGKRIHLQSAGIGIVLGLILTLVLIARLRPSG